MPPYIALHYITLHYLISYHSTTSKLTSCVWLTLLPSTQHSFAHHSPAYVIFDFFVFIFIQRTAVQSYVMNICIAVRLMELFEDGKAVETSIQRALEISSSSSSAPHDALSSDGVSDRSNSRNGNNHNVGGNNSSNSYGDNSNSRSRDHIGDDDITAGDNHHYSERSDIRWVNAIKTNMIKYSSIWLIEKRTLIHLLLFW